MTPTRRRSAPRQPRVAVAAALSTLLVLLLFLALLLAHAPTWTHARRYGGRYADPARSASQTTGTSSGGGGGEVDTGARAPPLTHEPLLSSRVRLPQFCLGPPPFPRDEYMDFEMFGSAKIVRGKMEITSPAQSQRGVIWSRKPITGHGLGKNWQVDLRFEVGNSPNREFYGDGFAFWVAQERGQMGEALGGPDTWTGVAVFFDTFKNQNFQFKKHPYVYGKVSNGHDQVHYKNVNDEGTPGCHVPFRDPDAMATAVARVTLMDQVLSVVMRPQGAVDWVQCFEIKGVTVPPNSFIGVSAMTGGLVDQHDFVQITTWGNVDVQPFSYALENKVHMMPDMWNAMRESGKVAREFEDWEEHDSFADDLEWVVSEKVKSHTNDDYVDPYEEEEGGGGGDDGESGAYAGDDADHPYAEYGEERAAGGEDADEDAEQHAQRPREGARRATSFDDDPDKLELLRDLDKVLKNHPVGNRLRETHVVNARRMETVHQRIRHEMQAATDTLHRAAREIRQKEHELSERILALGERAKVELIDPFEREAQAAARSWFWPFLLTVAGLAALASFGYTRYRKFMKSHVL